MVTKWNIFTTNFDITGVPGGGAPVIGVNGNSGDTVVPDASNEINILAVDTEVYNANGISTSGSGSTLTVLLNNRVKGTAQTVGAVTSDIITFDCGATPATYHFNISISGYEDDTPSSAAYDIDIAIRTTGTAAVLIDSDLTPQEEAALAACDVTVSVNLNNLIVTILGSAGLTVDWTASGYYQRAIKVV